MAEVEFRLLTPESLNQIKSNEECKPQSPKESLQDGMYLSDDLKKAFPKELFLEPLQEIDNYYEVPTFVVIDQNYVIHRYSATNSLFLFSPFNFARRWSIKIETSLWFRIFVSLTAIWFTFWVFIAHHNYTLSVNLDILVQLWFIEFGIRVVASGFLLNPFACLRSPLTLIDFIALISSLVDLFLERIVVITSIFRALRMGDMFISKNVRLIGYTVKTSLKSSITAFLIFIITTFSAALIGMSCFRGKLAQFCATKDAEAGTYDIFYGEDFTPVPCQITGTESSCPNGKVCVYDEFARIGYLHTSFDSFMWSFVNALRTLMLDYLEDLYLKLYVGAGSQALFYFLPMVSFGSVFFIGLFSVIVYSGYQKAFKLFGSTIENKEETPPESEMFILSALRSCWSCECFAYLVSIRNKLRDVVTNPFVELFFKFCILLNVVPCFYAKEITFDHPVDTLVIMIWILYWIFVVEVISKLIALSPSTYFKSAWNGFDVFLLFATLLTMSEVIGPPLRLLKVFSVLTYFNFHLRVLGKCMNKLYALMLPVLVIVFSSAMIGYFTFSSAQRQQRAVYGPENPRKHFQDPMSSILYAFELVNGEWAELSWSCGVSFEYYVCLLYHPTVAALGKYILQSVFLAVLVLALLTDNTTETEELPPDVAVIMRLCFRTNLNRPSNEDTEAALPSTNGSKPVDIEDRRESVSPLADTVLEDEPSRLKQIVESRGFQIFIAVVITISYAILAIQWETTSFQVAVICNQLEMLVALIYLVELVMKLMVYGRTYFTSLANCIDFLIVLESVCTFFLPLFGTIKVFRIFRVYALFLSDIRIQVVHQTFLSSVKSISKASIAVVIAWFLFAVLGVEMFHGELHHCVDTLGSNISSESVLLKEDCLSSNLTWVNNFINFDDISNAYWALLQLGMLKGQVEIESILIKKHWVGLFPKAFLITFTMIGGFITMKLFSAIVIAAYRTEKRKLLPKSLKDVVDEKLAQFMPYESVIRPKEPLEQTVFDVVLSKYYEIFMDLFLLANLFVICFIEYEPKEKSTFAIINEWLLIVYAFDSFAKCIALKVDIFKRPWFVFDCVVLVLQILAVLGFVFDGGVNDFNPSVLRVLHLFRMCGKYLPSFMKSDFYQIVATLRKSIPMLFRTYFFLAFVMAIYCFYGCVFFSHIKPKLWMTKEANFQSFTGTFLLMWPAGTTSGWDGLLEAVTDTSDCRPDTVENFENRGNCGHPLFGQIYMLTFIIIVWFIVYNMAVAIVFEAFLEQTEEEEEYGLNDSFLENFVQVWKTYDPNDKGVIDAMDLPKLLGDLKSEVSSNSDQDTTEQSSALVFSNHQVLTIIAESYRKHRRG